MKRLRITVLVLSVATTACNLYFDEPKGGGGSCPGPHCGPTAPDAGIIAVYDASAYWDATIQAPDAWPYPDAAVHDGGGCCGVYDAGIIVTQDGGSHPDACNGL